jgi:hypothetical protein
VPVARASQHPVTLEAAEFHGVPILEHAVARHVAPYRLHDVAPGGDFTVHPHRPEPADPHAVHDHVGIGDGRSEIRRRLEAKACSRLLRYVSTHARHEVQRRLVDVLQDDRHTMKRRSEGPIHEHHGSPHQTSPADERDLHGASSHACR